MTKEKLNEILEKHKHWIKKDCEGWECMRADLWGADLRGADLWRADLRGAEIENTTKLFIPLACPTDGAFIGWKKAYYIESDEDEENEVRDAIVKLLIPEDAKRSSSTTNKCRADKATVLAVYDMETRQEIQSAYSQHDSDFTYEKGKELVIEDFNNDRWNECSTGIHFFIDRGEAERYNL